MHLWNLRSPPSDGSNRFRVGEHSVDCSVGFHSFSGWSVIGHWPNIETDPRSALCRATSVLQFTSNLGLVWDDTLHIGYDFKTGEKARKERQGLLGRWLASDYLTGRLDSLHVCGQ